MRFRNKAMIMSAMALLAPLTAVTASHASRPPRGGLVMPTTSLQPVGPPIGSVQFSDPDSGTVLQTRALTERGQITVRCMLDPSTDNELNVRFDVIDTGETTIPRDSANYDPDSPL